MPNEEIPQEPTSRPFASRRARMALALAGLTAVGTGSYVVADRFSVEETAETTAGTPLRTSAGNQTEVGSVSSPASPAIRSSSQPAVPATPAPDESASARSASAEPRSDAERVKAAKSFAAKHGVTNFHPVIPRDQPELSAAAAAATVTTTGSAEQGKTMRIITAKGDLTGQLELGWVAGGITKVGEVSCSQTFRLANEEKPRKKPSMAVCWRTSAEKSVAAVTVNLHGKPSFSEGAAVIMREWRELG
ncbi:hypothetical protein [Actinoplanes solisilvae]|uniref:hypothetical protein n=1 Tax=Actinoplanes solisilvae TaxID=2486853 RepID=UPI000FD78EE4|nr:hypothetical protein [Actinoplanes solisilvae]